MKRRAFIAGAGLGAAAAATTIAAPDCRGADEKVRTTVPTPAVPPARQTASRSPSTSLTLPKIDLKADRRTLDA